MKENKLEPITPEAFKTFMAVQQRTIDAAKEAQAILRQRYADTYREYPNGAWITIERRANTITGNKDGKLSIIDIPAKQRQAEVTGASYDEYTGRITYTCKCINPDTGETMDLEDYINPNFDTIIGARATGDLLEKPQSGGQ